MTTPQSAYQAYVEDQVNFAWQRKSGLDTRALALITINVGLAALYFTIRTSLHLSEPSYSTGPKALVIIATTLSFISLAAAGIVVLPVAFLEPDISELNKGVARIQTNGGEDFDGEGNSLEVTITMTCILQLERISKMNQFRGIILYGGFVCVVVTVALVVTALVWAN